MVYVIPARTWPLRKYLKSMAKILLIEDDKATRILYRDILEDEGHSVTEAEDGAKGMAYIRTNPVDVIITDLIMPVKDGIEVINETTQSDTAIPIIAISGGGLGAPDPYLSAAKALGANVALKKPISRNEFLSAVDECLTIEG
jgi:CheY-like chemotaxis protein